MTATTDPIHKIITSCWRGEQPLWLVFWVYTDLIITPLVVAQMYIINDLEINKTSQWLIERGGALAFNEFISQTMTVVGFFLLFLFLFVWTFVSIWRCSRNSKRIWRWLARLYLLVLGVSTPVSLWGNILYSINH